jgi:hypothetical protein
LPARDEEVLVDLKRLRRATEYGQVATMTRCSHQASLRLVSKSNW